MSEVKVNKISPRTACGTVTLGDSGDTFTIPSGATITNAGTASGFGATGETSWDTTVKTTGTFTATAGVGYFLNTTGGIITVNLPVGAAGSSVALADYAGTWQTSNVTVAANGTEKIGGVDADVTLSTEGQSVTFVYIDGTQGWVNVLDSTSNVRGSPFLVATGGTPSQCGDYEIRTFTGPGTFNVTTAGASAPNNAVDWLVVAGGGGATGIGPGANAAGAGGAGGFRESPGTATGSYSVSPLAGNSAVTVTASPYSIVVGGGGTAGSGGNCGSMGGNGNVSTFSSYTSTGGGAGAGENTPAGMPARLGIAGGSGGGAGGGAACTAGGAGNTPPVSPAQGTAGGNSGAPPDGLGGGGGGATVAGGNSAPAAGTGGAGGTTSISGCATTYSGGGGGGGNNTTPGPGAAGPGGGGAGGANSSPGTAGTVNRGGGAGGTGGSTSNAGVTGGSGIVVIRYKFQ
jgi:hypothetical protein